MKGLVLPTGDNLEGFVAAWLPLANRVFSEVLGRFIDSSDDASTDILEALAEVAGCYDPQRGSIASFVTTVGRRRAIDFLRHKVRNPEIYFSDLEREDEDGNILLFKEQILAPDNSDPVAILLGRERTTEFSDLLRQFSVRADWYMVIQHTDTLRWIGRAAAFILENEEVLDRFLQTRRLPTKALIDLGRSKKSLDRLRPVIVGAVLYRLYATGFFEKNRRH